MKNELYEQYYLNFISPIPRGLLEDIAQAAITANCVTQINKVYDQYLNFISLDDEMFCLRHQNKEAISYYCKKYDQLVIHIFVNQVSIKSSKQSRCDRESDA